MQRALPRPPALSRNAAIAGGVLLFHAAALWALQSGLLRQAAEIVLPVELVAQWIEPPAPKIEPPAPLPPAPVAPPEPERVVRKPTPAPAPQPLAIPDSTPAPNAPTGVIGPQAPAPPIEAPVAAAPVAPAPPPAPPAPPAPPKVVQPSTDADYLQNPPPVYPPMSKRLGEQGEVRVGVEVSSEGRVLQARLNKSSGFERLDQAALATITKWRFRPGTVDGTPRTMWYQVPLRFVLD